ncbi:FtsX-like permease family protein [Streptomyces sp. NPDC048290]|uniref:ABC transporter permease n=1 Tax=Streptomyces sp. NPDC048290 TaxID=3155811 RepID=UPI003414DA27
MTALGKVVRAGVGRRRVQTVVMVLTTLVAVAASVVAVGVLAASRAPFAQAMDELRGAHLAARFEVDADDGGAGGAGDDGIGASARAAGVDAAAGPFRVVDAQPRTVSASSSPSGGPGVPAGVTLPSMTVVGRADAEGPVDRLSLVAGEWADGPGELVVAEGATPLSPGARLEFTGVPGSPTLTVVGVARSVTGTADAWTTPARAAAMAAPDAPATYQMLYRFQDAGSEADMKAARAAIGAAGPEGALTGTRSHLAVEQERLANTLAFVPFVAAFGVLGLALSVLIIGIVVSGAVGAARRRIGVLKALGFTPGQVVRAYVAQALVPAGVGCVLGAVLGRVLAGPVLGTVEDAYGGAPATVPWWVYAAVSGVALALVAGAALVPALRAGRLPSATAITVGRTPGDGRGRRARRLTGRLPVPRPLSLGLAQPFTRPARTATTGAAVALAALTMTFAVGLGLSLSAVQTHRILDSAAPVVVDAGPGGGPPGAQAVPAPGQEPAGGSGSADPDAIAAVLRAQPDTRRFYGTVSTEVTASGVGGRTSVTGYSGDARWGAPRLVSGRWFTAGTAGEAVVTDRFLRAAGVSVGDTVTLSARGRETTVRIVGEAFFTENDGMTVLTATATLAALGLDGDPVRFHVQPDPGVSTDAYVSALGTALDGTGGYAHPGGDRSSSVIVAMDALIAMLTVLLVAVAGLGVLNTVVLDTRDRVHALGVHKALGMTPRQTVGMVLVSVAGVGLAAGAVGVPLGVLLHRRVMPLMGDAVGMNLPESFVAVHSVPVLVLLVLGGPVVAVAGALLPAGWAARVDAGRALRAE